MRGSPDRGCVGVSPMHGVGKVARPEGLEPPTNRFEVCDSIQLSYGRCQTEIVPVSTHFPQPAGAIVTKQLSETPPDSGCPERGNGGVP